MKKPERSKNSSVPPQAGPDVAGFMVKIQEQLAFLGKKMDALFGQISAKPSEKKDPPKSLRQADRDKFIAQPHPAQRPVEAKQSQGRPRGRANIRRERVLHKAVCAECHKDCEIPFKPSGERPVYCKECFAKRKAGSSPPKVATDQGQVPAPRRHVTVIKKGAGKVTVSEVRAPSAVSSPATWKQGPSPKGARDIPPKRKSYPPGKKPEGS